MLSGSRSWITGPVNASICVKQFGDSPSVGSVIDRVVEPVVIVPVDESNSVCGNTRPSPPFRYTAIPMDTGSHNGAALFTVNNAWLPSVLRVPVICASLAGSHAGASSADAAAALPTDTTSRTANATVPHRV